MNNRWGLLAIALTLIALGGALVLVIVPAPPTPLQMATTSATDAAVSTNTGMAGIADTIVVSAPLPGSTLGSTTLALSGEARGSWYFEASFPVELLDASGTVIAQGPAQAQSDWTTNDFIPFATNLSYPAQPSGSHGTLILKNENPSGDPSKDQQVSIPVVFN